MQPFSLLRTLRRDSIDYVRGKYPFLSNERPDLDEQLLKLLSESGTLFQDPVIQLGRTRKKTDFDPKMFGRAIQNTVETLPELRSPYAHQVVAWKQISEQQPTVVSTGTGSGKSESFIIPVLDGLAKLGLDPSKKSVGGLFIYPMNALVHDQFIRIFKYAAGSGLRVGIYNGAFKELSDTERKKICNSLDKIYKDLKKERPDLEIGYDFNDPKTLVVDPEDPRTYPHILLTNYKMLEYMLLRAQDQPLIEAFDLKYLVLDEAHTYTGTLALEISCLLARLRVHLGPEKSKYLPIATSATLAAGSLSESDIEKELSTFFTKLFGKQFPKRDFLVGEQYQELPEYSRIHFTELLKIEPEEIAGILSLPFPQSLFQVSRLLFKLDSSEETVLAGELHRKLSGLEKEVASVLLKSDTGALDSTLIWATACERFKARIGGSPELLEALLVCLSQAYIDPKFPLLGLRVHLFGRTEPKILWSLDGKRIGDDRLLGETRALSLVSCKRCDHLALAGVAQNAGGEGNVSEDLEVAPLSDFRDEVRDITSLETMVFHPEASLSQEDIDVLSKSWGKPEKYSLVDSGKSVKASLVGAGSVGKGYPFLRFVRTGKKGKTTEEVPDVESCPKCGATGRNDSPVMVTHRGGAATDISVYAASLLTNNPNHKEQKLLIFSDNRQETSFLAGFLTDRHRKINLRRALTGYLEECHAITGVNSIEILRGFERSQNNSKSYDLAIRLLGSIEFRKAILPEETLPASIKLSKSTIQNLVPRSVLDRPWWKKPKSGRIDEEVESVKQWLLENYRVDDSNRVVGEADETFDILDGSFRSRWLLLLITELLFLDLSAGALAEGNLAVLGIAVLEPKAFSEELFSEWASKNADLGLSSRGVFTLAHWLMSELQYAGAWSDMDDTGLTREGFLPKHIGAQPLPMFFAEKPETGIIGKSIEAAEGINKLSRIAKILTDLDPENETELRKIWAKKASWDRLVQQSPLQRWMFYSSEGRDRPILRPYADWIISRNVSHYRGLVSHSEFTAVPSSFDLSGISTGKRLGDTWVKTPILPNIFYERLFRSKLSEQSRLVRAREHNGMLSAADANDALLKFEKNIVNTLIATPTLEMGVDLPELPAVIHRSVPPAPSNYAQRAGRAGRGPKRAIIVTYCGLGSHDMTFFENPDTMVSGEILPPGIPDRNPFIIKRHINGLILEVLGLRRPAIGPNLQIRYWHEVVDVRDLRNRLVELSRYSRIRPEFSDNEISSWQSILGTRNELKGQFTEQFIKELESSLWIDAKPDDRGRLEELKAELRRHASEFQLHFNAQIAAFRGLVGAYLDSMVPFKDLPSADDNAPFRQAKRFAELYLGANVRNRWEIPRPLNDLGATGFLPNFDFPGQVIRFKGLKDDNRKANENAGQSDQMLQYDRGGTVALREFAPDQKVYGHGFIYQVERYLENDLVENQAKGYGVCSEGCTTLSPPERENCVECGSSVLRIEKKDSRSTLVPEIVQIREVHGKQDRAISDGVNFRERHFFAEEARRIGAPVPDDLYEHVDDKEVSYQLHLTKEHYLKTVFLVLNGKQASKSTAQKVFYRRQASGTLYQVALQPKEGEQGWEPFIPSIQIEGQGIIFRIPLFAAHQNGLVAYGEVDALKVYQSTLIALIKRATQRLLRLGSRSGNFDIQVEQVMQQKGEGFEPSSYSFVILDREPGGSGVVPLIWEHWDAILDVVKEAVLKDCCVSSCYRCLRSFDNQSVHGLLDKHLFKVGEGVPIVEFLKRKNLEKIKQDELKKVDERSPAEAVFKEMLIQRYPGWTLETQVERLKSSGGLLSIPDFELERISDNRRITVFVDGWKYHNDPFCFYGDVRKRNELGNRGYCVVTVPAAIAMDYDKNREVLEGLLNDQQVLRRPFETVPGFELPNDPFASVDAEVKDQLMYLGVTFDRLEIINFKSGHERLGSNSGGIGKVLFQLGEKLPKSLRPFARVGDDQIISLLNGDQVLKDQEIWKIFWLYQSALAVVGYRPVAVWIGAKPRRS